MNTSRSHDQHLTSHLPDRGPLSSRRPSRERAADETVAARRSKDDELATRIALGDVDAAEALADRYTERLVSIALRIVDDEREAGRIAEAALEDACRGWPPERGQVARSLTRLVRRRARARLRLLSGQGD